MANSGYNNFGKITQQMHHAAAQVVAETAEEIVTTMQPMTPVDTGYLQSSEYFVTSKESTYGQASGTGESLAEVGPAENDTTAYAAVAATHGVYVEMGTSKMAAQPYFHPAVELVRPNFASKIGKIGSMLGQGLGEG